MEVKQSKNETIISIIKEEIENYKNEKQIQTNSIKQKTEEIHAKNKAIQEYENMCSKNEATTKKQETQIQSIIDNRSGMQNDLNQTKKWTEKLPERLFRTNPKATTIRTKTLRISRPLFIKRTKHQTTRRHSQAKRNTIDILKGNIEDNKKFIERNQNHQRNETEIYNSTQQDHDYAIKQNTKANTIYQPVPETKSLHHKNVPTKIAESITWNCPNNDPCNNKSKTYETINETTKKISIPSDIIDNVIGKTGYRVQQIQNTYNVKVHTKFQNRSIQDIKVTGNEHQMNIKLNVKKNIITCENCLNKTYYDRRPCNFLHYSLHPQWT